MPTDLIQGDQYRRDPKQRLVTQDFINRFCKNNLRLKPEIKKNYPITSSLQNFSRDDLLIGYSPKPFSSHF